MEIAIAGMVSHNRCKCVGPTSYMPERNTGTNLDFSDVGG
jgi:hypothetical protein